MTVAAFDGVVEVDVDGFRGAVRTRVEGPAEAPVLLAVHGFAGSMYWWERTTRLLADELRVVRVDLAGHGETGGPAADAPVQARAVAGVLAYLGMADVAVAGHSFGADVAVELAETCPAVTSLVVVCQAPDYSDARLPRGRTLMTMPRVARVLQTVADVALHGVVAVRGRIQPNRADADLADHAARDLHALNPAMFRVVLIDRRDRMAKDPLDVQLVRAGLPTLVVLGGADHFYGARSADRYRATGAQVTVLPDSGHSPLVEQPEVLATALLRFVRGRSETQ